MQIRCSLKLLVFWCVCGALVCSGQQTISAQEATQSHRRLRLPEGGSGDLQTQLQMLSHLRTLMQGQQAPVDVTPPAISPEQIGMVQQMMKSFAGDVPDDLIKEVGKLPPELLSGIANDPQARSAIQDMLKQFSNDQSFPRSSGNGPPMLPPALRDAVRKFQQRDRGESELPGGGRESLPSRRTADTGIESIDRMLEKLRGYEQQQRNRRTPEPELDRDVRRQQSGSDRRSPRKETDGREADRRTDRRKPSGRPMSHNEANDRVDELLRQKNGVLEPARRPPFTGQSNRQSNPQGNRSPDGVSTSGGADNPRRSARSVTSVPEFLRNYKEMIPDLEGAVEVAASRGDQSGRIANQDSAGRDPLPPPAAELREENLAELREQRQAVKEQLSQRGFTETLKNIGRDAIRQARQSERASRLSVGSDGNAGGGSAPGITGAVAEAISGIAKDVIQMIKDGDIKPGATSPRNRSRRVNDSPSMFSQLTDSAEDLMGDVAAATDSSPVSAASEGLGSPGMNGGSMVPVLVLLCLVAVAVALAWKSGLVGTSDDKRQRERVLAPEHIRTRADVVRAFHQMALKPGCDSQDWWTHQRVVETLVTHAPGKSSQAMTLARLYEQARYLPEDVPFTDAEIRDAKQALAQCQ